MSQRNLKDMTLAELWALFPIVLTAYNPDWSEWANEEILELTVLLKDYNPISSGAIKILPLLLKY